MRMKVFAAVVVAVVACMWAVEGFGMGKPAPISGGSDPGDAEEEGSVKGFGAPGSVPGESELGAAQLEVTFSGIVIRVKSSNTNCEADISTSEGMPTVVARSKPHLCTKLFIAQALGMKVKIGGSEGEMESSGEEGKGWLWGRIKGLAPFNKDIEKDKVIFIDYIETLPSPLQVDPMIPELDIPKDDEESEAPVPVRPELSIPVDQMSRQPVK